jgi:hypothetical protein
VPAKRSSAPPLPSTLPPARAAKAKARPVDDGIPKGSLPKPKKKVAKPKAAPRAKSARKADPSPPWDADKEAFLAKQAVLERAKEKLAAIVVPPVSRKKRERVFETREDMPHGGSLKRRVRTPEEKAARPEVVPVAKREYVPMTDELFRQICAEIAEGVPLRQICRRAAMPSKSGFYQYLEGDDLESGDASAPDVRSGRLARYARARKLGFDDLAEEALEIADDASNDWLEREGEDGEVALVPDKEGVPRSKLRVETRLKLLAVWDPKRYGNMLKLGDPDARPLEQAGKSANDLAIGIAKLLVAAKHESGQPLEAE